MPTTVPRLLEICAAEAGVALPEPFEPKRLPHVELAAGLLVQRFRERDDVEAFTLLVELSQARLRMVAGGVARRLGLLLDPDDLVAALLARLFTDVRKQPPVRHFFALARKAMTYDALNQLRLHRRAQRRGASWGEMLVLAGGSIDPALAIEEAEHEAGLSRIGTLVLLVTNQCFHALGARERRVLRLREVDGLSYDALAGVLGLPRSQVGMVLKRARERLARGIADTLTRAGAGPCAPPSRLRSARAALSAGAPVPPALESSR